MWHTPNTRITEIGNARTNIAVKKKIEHAPARVAYAKHADYGNRERENNFPRKGGTAGGCKKQPEVALGCKGSARGSMEQQGAARAARSSKGQQGLYGAARGCKIQSGQQMAHGAAKSSRKVQKAAGRLMHNRTTNSGDGRAAAGGESKGGSSRTKRL